MIKDEFKLAHHQGKLMAIITIEGETYEMDVTEYFENDNPHDDWLDYRLEQQGETDSKRKGNQS